MPQTDDDTPTGRQFRIARGDQSAVVVELGAALRHYEAGGRPVLDGFAADDRISGGRGQLLVPWPNRITDGRYPWEGGEQQLPLTEPARGNAIHGLLRWTSWQPLEHGEDRVVLGATVWPQPGYPFRLDVRAEYALGPGGLEVAVTARNRSGAAAPYGIGQHPYLTAGTDLVDEAVLTVPARLRLRTGDRGTPVGDPEPVDGTPYDFRTPRPVGALELDTAYTGLEAGPGGRPAVRLAHPSGEHGTDLWLGEGVRAVQLFTGDTLAEGARRRGLAVEPMSCPPDAFRSGTDLVVLAPGERHVLRWGLTPWRA
ncbi:aldose 1-epimerase family protein [Streptacidiphilus sp. ASG 303]|uniref:aldose 1-epimerase family protein n=1 Tax=Streptacidiphilus sp. ASG 303 TaxID=2896847 RepID=UPI001E5660CB|nr:aldose 1-epimerase family protein [Streptacidiphilus sp. ASG 303]MCD0484475.1 aldose 1-epimerase family protein [Streptacidiphilus sp. ASG 303]